MKNNLKDNKGFTGLDISVSLIIIVISITVIASMFYSLYLSGTGLKRNVIATDYAINILEKIQTMDYDDVNYNNLNLKNELDSVISNEGASVQSRFEGGNYIVTVNNYKISVNIENYSETHSLPNDYIKIIKVSIEYNLGKNNKETLEISTLKTIK